MNTVLDDNKKVTIPSELFAIVRTNIRHEHRLMWTKQRKSSGTASTVLVRSPLSLNRIPLNAC